eukprot:355528-Hanusia_phi.AAC.1
MLFPTLLSCHSPLLRPLLTDLVFLDCAPRIPPPPLPLGQLSSSRRGQRETGGSRAVGHERSKRRGGLTSVEAGKGQRGGRRSCERT